MNTNSTETGAKSVYFKSSKDLPPPKTPYCNTCAHIDKCRGEKACIGEYRRARK